MGQAGNKQITRKFGRFDAKRQMFAPIHEGWQLAD
jgi:hypothetical protein